MSIIGQSIQFAVPGPPKSTPPGNVFDSSNPGSNSNRAYALDLLARSSATYVLAAFSVVSQPHE